MTPHKDRHIKYPDFKKIVNMQPDQTKIETIFECIWSDESTLKRAHDVTPHRYPGSSSGSFCYRLRQLLLPIELVDLLRPTEYFSMEGVKYLMPVNGTTPIRQMLEDRKRLRIGAFLPYRNSSHLPKINRQSSTSMKNSIKAMETVLCDPEITVRMRNEDIEDLKDKMLRLTQKLEETDDDKLKLDLFQEDSGKFSIYPRGCAAF